MSGFNNGHHDKSTRNRNPYAGVDWQTTCRVSGCTHMHCVSSDILKRYLDAGLELVSLSNYYPSMPWFPLASLREGFFRVRQSGYILGNVWHQDTLNVNTAIAGWKEKLASEDQAQLPFREGEKLFPELFILFITHLSLPP